MYMQTGKREKILASAAAGLTVLAIMLVLFMIGHYAPFGEKSLVSMDANIQYLDFYCYLKDCFSGTNDLSYSFSKVLGGNMAGVISYYLTSPFSLLSLLFEKEDLILFFHLMLSLKMATAAVTFCWFLLQRFAGRCDSRAALLLCAVLAAGYGVNQYTIAQSSNILWLDGVYMLPVILLQIYHVVRGRSGWRLALAVGLTVLFNWYIAGVSLIFAAFWFCLESLIFLLHRTERVRETLLTIVKNGARCLGHVLLGLLLSCILFLPTIYALQNSARGSLQLSNLKDLSLLGNASNIIDNYVYGRTSALGSAALFCGGLGAIGLIVFFLSRKIKRRDKFAGVCLCLFVVLSMYWNPLYQLFSLLQNVYSYWYRFSFLAIFSILFLAAAGLLAALREDQSALPLKAALLFDALLLLLVSRDPPEYPVKSYLTAMAVLVLGALVSAAFHWLRKGKGRAPAIGLLAVLFVLHCGDLAYNARALARNYSASNVVSYPEYVSQTQQQLDALQALDGSLYRIHQTSTRNMRNANLTANYNEALAFGYYSISGYTSSPDENQRIFLERMGYRKEGSNMNVTNASVLATDSLLGVKYVLSSYPQNGLLPVDSIPERNGKTVYENPYCLPLAFCFTPGQGELNTSNTFEFQNSLYSYLLGEESALYLPVSYSVEGESSSDGEQGMTIRLEVPEGNYALYGNIPWYARTKAELWAGDTLLTAYTEWLSPSIFYIPFNGEAGTVEVSVRGEYDLRMDQSQFYVLDLDRLEEVTGRLSSHVPDALEMEHGSVRVRVQDAAAGEYLLLSVGEDRGWSILRNGEEITPELAGGYLYAIELTEGDNQIELRYHLPGFAAGCACSLAALAVIVGTAIYSRRRAAHGHPDAGQDA